MTKTSASDLLRVLLNFSETQGGEGGFLFSMPALSMPALSARAVLLCHSIRLPDVCSAGRGDLTGQVSLHFLPVLSTI